MVTDPAGITFDILSPFRFFAQEKAGRKEEEMAESASYALLRLPKLPDKPMLCS